MLGSSCFKLLVAKLLSDNGICDGKVINQNMKIAVIIEKMPNHIIIFFTVSGLDCKFFKILVIFSFLSLREITRRVIKL